MSLANELEDLIIYLKLTTGDKYTIDCYNEGIGIYNERTFLWLAKNGDKYYTKEDIMDEAKYFASIEEFKTFLIEIFN